MKKQFAAAIIAVAGLTLGSVVLTACNSANNNITISGAGSTFVNPVMSRWTVDFSQTHPNIHINYQSIGSGGGIQQVKAGTVNFGASDAALNDQQLAAMKPVVQFPETAGPVCITYNLPGLSAPLLLPGRGRRSLPRHHQNLDRPHPGEGQSRRQATQTPCRRLAPV